MSGYSLPLLAVRASPHLRRVERPDLQPCTDRERQNSAVEPDPSETFILDVTGQRATGAAARWLAIRERWSQLTFYLFDPNSWR